MAARNGTTGTNFLSHTYTLSGGAYSGRMWVNVRTWRSAFGLIFIVFGENAGNQLAIGFLRGGGGTGTENRIDLIYYNSATGGFVSVANGVISSLNTWMYLGFSMSGTSNASLTGYWGSETATSLSSSSSVTNFSTNSMGLTYVGGEGTGSQMSDISVRGIVTWTAARTAADHRAEWANRTFAPLITTDVQSYLPVASNVNPEVASLGDNWSLNGTFSNDTSDPRPPQFLTPGSIASSNTVRNPTVLPGPRIIVPDAITTSAVVRNPTMSPGSVNVILDAVDAQSTVRNPQINQLVLPGEVESVASGLAPDLVPGAASILPSDVSTEALVRDPGFSLGAVAIVPDPIATAAIVDDPEVVPEGSSISLDEVSTGSEIGDPSIALAVTPQVTATESVVSDPVAAPGGVSVVPEAVASSATVRSPSADMGVHPASIGTEVSVLDPDLAPGVVVANVGSVLSEAFVQDPEFSESAFLQPGVVAPEAAVNEPTIDPGGFSIQLEVLPISADLGAPRANLGIAPNPVAPEAEILDPEFTFGPAAIVPGFVETETGVEAPHIIPGAISVEPDEVATFASLDDPSIAAGGAALVPDVIAANTAVRSPSVVVDSSLLLDAVAVAALVLTPAIQPGEIEIRPSPLETSSPVLAPGLAFRLNPGAISSSSSIPNPAFSTGGVFVTLAIVPTIGTVRTPRVVALTIGRQRALGAVDMRHPGAESGAMRGPSTASVRWRRA